jgi:signal transduction histidine kinase
MSTLRDETRSAELKRYARFTPADEAALADARSRVVPSFERIAAVFYDRIREHEGARAVISGDARITLQRTLVGWLDRLFGGTYDEAYFAMTAQIGRTHERAGLPQRYMPTAMGLVRAELVAALDRPEDEPARQAVGRLLDVELAVMLDAFHEDHVERVAARERDQQQRRLAAIATLTTGLAHEIRNPLNGARLHAEVIERALARTSAPEALEAVRVVKGEIQRLARIVDELLEFAQSRPLARTLVDARTLVERVVASSAGVVTDIPSDEVALTADMRRLEEALRALLTNAVEAGAGRVVVRVRREPRLVLFEVEDDGPGFDPRTPVFDPFYTTKADGTGLGLAIVQRTATDHGGTVDVESRPGYTRFRLILPWILEGTNQ